MSNQILLVDDDISVCQLVAIALGERGFMTRTVSSGEQALEIWETEIFEAVVTDIHMRGMNGIDLCNTIVQSRPNVPVIVITAFGSLDAAVAAIRAGASDFVTKPINIDALTLTLERALKHRRLSEEVKRLPQAVIQSECPDELHGSSPPMKKVYSMLERVADSDASVLITGESGTGKEVVARVLHKRSRRASGPFIAVNCAAMPESLLESELFGHAKGAFTDAKNARTGLFVQANGGTLFLDEIGDMPLALQPKILRALQEKVVRPVGGNHEVPYDAHIIAATNRDIESAVDEGRFRRDLYFRINVIQLIMPPLRARGADVLTMAQTFIQQYALQSEKAVVGLSTAAAEKLLAYSWPGNVRELQNCMHRAVALTCHDQIVPEDLPEKIRDYKNASLLVVGQDPSELITLEEMERRYILHVLNATGGNKSLAARVLRLDRKTLYRKLERYGAIDVAEPPFVPKHAS